MIITIDGPTASGKSTIARKLALKLGITYINTGLLFRAIAYLVNIKHDINLNELLLESKENPLQYRYSQEHGAQIFYNDTEITPLLKTELMDLLASRIALNEDVRGCIEHYQKQLACTQSVIADGRDCGTIIFPHADYKFYITARLEVRASRWQQDQEKKGFHYSLNECKKLLEERDLRDSTRTLAPLAIPHGALIIDTSTMNIEEVITTCLAEISKSMPAIV